MVDVFKHNPVVRKVNLTVTPTVEERMAVVPYVGVNCRRVANYPAGGIPDPGALALWPSPATRPQPGVGDMAQPIRQPMPCPTAGLLAEPPPLPAPAPACPAAGLPGRICERMLFAGVMGWDGGLAGERQALQYLTAFPQLQVASTHRTSPKNCPRGPDSSHH